MKNGCSILDDCGGKRAQHMTSVPFKGAMKVGAKEDSKYGDEAKRADICVQARIYRPVLVMISQSASPSGFARTRRITGAKDGVAVMYTHVHFVEAC